MIVFKRFRYTFVLYVSKWQITTKIGKTIPKSVSKPCAYQPNVFLNEPLAAELS